MKREEGTSQFIAFDAQAKLSLTSRPILLEIFSVRFAVSLSSNPRKKVVLFRLVSISPEGERFSIEIQNQSLFIDHFLIDNDGITRQTGIFCHMQIS